MHYSIHFSQSEHIFITSCTSITNEKLQKDPQQNQEAPPLASLSVTIEDFEKQLSSFFIEPVEYYYSIVEL